jgi:hypothetical protein
VVTRKNFMGSQARPTLLFLLLTLFALGAATVLAKPTKPVKKYAQRVLEGWKFDHKGHEAAAAKAGGARGKAACVDCHQYKADGTIALKGGQEHGTRCVKCHEETTTKCKVDAKGTHLRCQSCHTFDAADPCHENVPKSLSKPHTQQSAFSHGQHLGFGVAIEKNCANCHRDKAPAGTAAFQAHQSCFGCHGEKGKPATVSTKLFWNNCEGCHGAGKPKAPASGDPFRLTKFDHQRHHADSRQSSCSTCHTKMSGTDATSVPRPSMESCLKSCHDGSKQNGKAFSAVGTKCTTCHQSAGGLTMPVTKGVTFSHEAHSKRNTKIEGHCQDCHSVAADGAVLAPNTGKDHAPCANAGCHQTEFMSKTTKICFVCHEDSPVPWKKLQARMQDPSPKQEFFENISHASHLQKKGTTNAACTDCHGDKLGGGKAPKDHQACAECHGKGAPAHPMSECDKCHSRNAVARPKISEWSVASTFDHKRHANDSRPTSRGTAQCVGCHAEIGKSTSLATMAKPKMQSCEAGCHNGKVSFKTTGFDCAKCHIKPNQPSTPPATSGLTTSGGGPTAMLDPAPVSRLGLTLMGDYR